MYHLYSISCHHLRPWWAICGR